LATEDCNLIDCVCDVCSAGQNVTFPAGVDAVSSSASVELDRRSSSSSTATPSSGGTTTATASRRRRRPAVRARPRSRRCSTDVDIESIQLASQNLHERARCPWTYTYNVDPDRVPRTLVEAQCSSLTAADDLAGQCETVYYHVPVRQNASGVWTERWLRLRVGCTLATPLTAPPITYD